MTNKPQEMRSIHIESDQFGCVQKALREHRNVTTNALDGTRKLLVMNTCIHSLIDEFFMERGRFPEGEDLPDYLDIRGATPDEILRIIDRRNSGLPFRLSREIAKYPNFWEDLARNVHLEGLPRSIRPARSVT